MKALLLIPIFVVCSLYSYGQNTPSKNFIAIDTLGNEAELLDLLEATLTGKYKIVYDRSNPKKTVAFLVATSQQERDSLMEIRKKKEVAENNHFLMTRLMGINFPDFLVTDLDKKKYRLSSLKGKVVVLNYWFVECMPCRLELPELNQLASDYAGDDQVLFLSLAKSQEDKVRKFLKTRPHRYLVALITNDHAIKMGINGYPTNVVIDKTGKCIFASEGYVTNGVDQLRAMIQTALKE